MRLASGKRDCTGSCSAAQLFVVIDLLVEYCDFSVIDFVFIGEYIVQMVINMRPL